MTSTFRSRRFIAARTAAFATLLILSACGGGGGGGGGGPTYSVGGSISGLVGSGLVLTAGAGNSVSVSQAGPFTFPTALNAGASYDVTVASPPGNPSQTCTVSNGAGTVAGTVDNITVVCVVSQFTVGGSISGLLGTGLILRDNSGDDLPVSSNGAFVFTNPVASGGAYSVSIVSPPSNPTQNCVLLAGSAAGTVSSGNITDVSVVCPSAGRFAYVTDEQSNQISGFTIDGGSGALTPMPTSPFAAPTYPTFLVADPSSRFLYVSSQGASGAIGTILAYSINQSTGALTAIQGFQFPLIDGGIVSPAELAIDASGKFLYASIQEPETGPSSPNLAVAAFTINHTDGTLTSVSGSPFAIGAYSIGDTPIVIGPSGQFLYIGYYNFGNSNSYVSAFSIDPTTGALTMVPGGPVLVGTPGPDSATIDPTGKFLYLGSISCSALTSPTPCGAVATLAIDAISGALTVTNFGTAGLEVGSSVTFNPSGNFAYGVFVQGITEFGVDATSGALTALAGSPYLSNMFDLSWPVVMDPSGNFAYLLTYGGILVLTVDPSTGALALVPGSPVAEPGAGNLSVLLDVP
jgi:6-phosphogluconolactonase